VYSNGSGANITIDGTAASPSSMYVRSGAIVNLNTTPRRSGIHLAGAGSNFYIEEGSTVNINVPGTFRNTPDGSPNEDATPSRETANGAGNNPISLGADANMQVNGALNITETNRGASPRNTIQAGARATFTVGAGGSLDIQSDSSAPAKRLINFGGIGGIFSFDGANRVNLQRTRALDSPGIATGLIGMQASGAVPGQLNLGAQEVSLWERGNLDAVPTRSWMPMYHMIIRYPGSGNIIVNTVLDSASLTQAMVDNFNANFRTNNAQRVLFIGIPDIFVYIDPPHPTDDVNSNSSRTITGRTNANAYVRISYTPIRPELPSAFLPEDNTVPSPAEPGSGTPPMNPPQVTDYFTVRADANGNFTYTIPDGSRPGFLAGSTIEVFAFANGKTGSAEVVVADATPPTAEAVEVSREVNEPAPPP
jgi:hypothetical protein